MPESKNKGQQESRAQIIHRYCVEAAKRGKAVYVFDGRGEVFEVLLASRDSRAYRRGELTCPKTATHITVEGDSNWQPLPEAVSMAEARRTELDRQKSARRAKKASRPVRSAASH